MTELGAYNCLHETEFVREDPPTLGRKYPLRWYRCKKCGEEFTEKYPTVFFRPEQRQGRDFPGFLGA